MLRTPSERPCIRAWPSGVELDQVAVGPDARVLARSRRRGSARRRRRRKSRAGGRGTGCGRRARRSRARAAPPPSAAPARRARGCGTGSRRAGPAGSGLPRTKQPMMSVPPEIDCSGSGAHLLANPVVLPVVQDRAGREHGPQGASGSSRAGTSRGPGRAGDRAGSCRTRVTRSAETTRQSASGPLERPVVEHESRTPRRARRAASSTSSRRRRCGRTACRRAADRTCSRCSLRCSSSVPPAPCTMHFGRAGGARGEQGEQRVVEREPRPLARRRRRSSARATSSASRSIGDAGVRRGSGRRPGRSTAIRDGSPRMSSPIAVGERGGGRPRRPPRDSPSGPSARAARSG